MKGRKGSVDEGGVRVPCLVRWPGHIRPGTRIHQIAGAIDLLPTFADLAGISLASRKPLDGTSLKPLVLENANVTWPDRMIFSSTGRQGQRPHAAVSVLMPTGDYSTWSPILRNGTMLQRRSPTSPHGSKEL